MTPKYPLLGERERKAHNKHVNLDESQAPGKAREKEDGSLQEREKEESLKQKKGRKANVLGRHR